MVYKIGQVAKKLGISTYTLRFYDKEGLLPNVKKNSAGIRVFNEADLDWLLIIECLKGTGMPLRNIKEYLYLCQKGDETLGIRLQMFKKQKELLKEQMEQLKQYMDKINFKISYYTEAVKHGSIDVYKYNECLSEARKKIFKTNDD